MAFASFDYPGYMLPEQVKLKNPVNQWFGWLFTTRLSCLTIIIPR